MVHGVTVRNRRYFQLDLVLRNLSFTLALIIPIVFPNSIKHCQKRILFKQSLRAYLIAKCSCSVSEY